MSHSFGRIKFFVRILCIVYCLLLFGCAAQQKFYKNTRYSGDIQAYLNRDMAYCHAVASGSTPIVDPYIPQSPTTTYGQGVVTDNYGNVYTGTYQKTTYPNENMELFRSINSLSRSIQASNIYAAAKARCLSALGWYEITQEEYTNSQNIYSQNDVMRKKVEEHNKAFSEKIQNEHPDFVSLNTENRKKILNDMQVWIKKKPYDEAETMMKIFRNGNAEEVSSLFFEYKKYKKIEKF